MAREMLVGRLDLPVLGFPRSPFEPPGQGGRREGKEQGEGNKKLLIVAPAAGFLLHPSSRLALAMCR